jgi:hypothetical protein
MKNSEYDDDNDNKMKKYKNEQRRLETLKYL